MSACAPSGGDPTHYAENAHEPNHSAADAHFFPPDPLLQPGSFIDTTPDLVPGQPARNGKPLGDERNVRGQSVDGVSSSAAGLSESAAAESTPSGRKGATAADSLAETPSWLPDGWRVITRVRASGATAGSTDRYYVDPRSGLQFRSKKEVEYYLQTGTKRKKAPTTDADGNSTDNQGTCKSKKSPGTKKESSVPPKFDYLNVPQEATWVLTDAAKDQWVPFIDDKMIPKSTRVEWESAFLYSLK